MIYTGNPVLFK